MKIIGNAYGACINLDADPKWSGNLSLVSLANHREEIKVEGSWNDMARKWMQAGVIYCIIEVHKADNLKVNASPKATENSLKVKESTAQTQDPLKW